MTYTVFVNVSIRPEILDPAGRVTALGLQTLAFDDIKSVRIGKRIALTIEAPSEADALARASAAASTLLANPIMETFTVSLS